jgi:hypothetical protein
MNPIVNPIAIPPVNGIPRLVPVALPILLDICVVTFAKVATALPI